MARRRWLSLILLASVSIASAQVSLPEVWVSKTSGIVYRVTAKGKGFRAEKVFAAEFAAQVADGAFTRCDYTPAGDAWMGKCESGLPLRNAKGQVKWCTFKFASKLTTASAERIEGESDVWANDEVNVEKCEVRKSHPQHFVWVPKS